MEPQRSTFLRHWMSVFALVLAALAPMGLVQAQDRATGAAAPAGSAADTEQMRRDIDALKKGQEAIQKSLEEIKALLKQAPPAARPPQAVPNVVLDLAGHPFEGSTEARLAVVEVSDYQCPYCARHTRETYPQLEKDFISTGKVRYAMLDFPLRNHPFAFKAAEAATCAADKGKFWEMHHLLFQNQNALNPETLPAYAEQIGLDRAEFEACLEEGRKESVNADLQQATKAGVSATPTFLIGWLKDGDQLKPAEVIRGAQSFENFDRVIKQLLEAGPPADKAD
jgi:protein-disulfide isomerase